MEQDPFISWDKFMVVIDNNFCVADVMTDNIIKLEVKAGVNVCEATAKDTVQEIVKIMPASFAILINRVNDYSVDPVSIYAYLSKVEPLKAFAIVVHRASYMEMMPMQQKLMKCPLKGFLTVPEAYEWLVQTLERIKGADT